MGLYTALVCVTIGSMLVTLVFIRLNETLNQNEKRIWRAIILIIIMGTSAEHAGTLFDYFRDSIPGIVLVQKIAKFVEYSFSPYLTLLFLQLNTKNKKILNFLRIVIIVNFVLEFISGFVGNIYCIRSDGSFTRGNMFFIFVIAYSCGFTCLIIELVRQSRTRQTKNYYCYIVLFIFLIVGIGIQLVKFELKVDWVAIAFTSILLLFQYCDLIMKKDGLTGLLNRKMFENMCREINFDSAIIIMDINDFRDVNNKYGHQDGDRCLEAISECVLKIYSQYGYCYRYGGDEIVIILKKNVSRGLKMKVAKDDICDCLKDLNKKFENSLDEKRMKISFLPNVSMGVSEYRYEYDSLVKVFKLADEKMYENKKIMKSKVQ